MTTEATKPRTSRVGKRPVDLPKGVTVSVNANVVEVKGPKGTISRKIPANVQVAVEGAVANVTSDAPGSAAPRLQGTTRAHLNNMVVGVSQGYSKTLELVGTGYRAELKGKTLHFSLGLSHPEHYDLPDSVTADIPKDSKGTIVVLNGIDKELLGQIAATIRSFRPPEPYAGKGVRLKGERVRRKAGKAGKKLTLFH